MEKKNIDWSSLGFGYVQTDYRYVSKFKDGAWDAGELTTDPNVTPVSYTHLDVYKRQTLYHAILYAIITYAAA